MRRVWAAGLAILLLAAGPAWSGEPTPRQRELSTRYMNAVRITDNLKLMADTMIPQMMGDAARASNLSPEDQAILQRVGGETAREIMRELIPKIVAEMQAVVAETFTEDELTQAIAFYESPVGRSITGKSALINEKFQPRMQPLMQESRELMIRRMLEKLCAEGKCQPQPKATGA